MLVSLTLFDYFIIVYTTINTESWVAILILVKMGTEIITGIVIFCNRNNPSYTTNESVERIKE